MYYLESARYASCRSFMFWSLPSGHLVCSYITCHCCVLSVQNSTSLVSAMVLGIAPSVAEISAHWPHQTGVREQHWTATDYLLATLMCRVAMSSIIWRSQCASVAHRNRSDFCDLRLRCPSRTPEIARFPRQETAMTHCDLRVRWKVASDLRFRDAISEPKTPSFCGISGDLAPSTRKSLAVAIVRFWCANHCGHVRPEQPGRNSVLGTSWRRPPKSKERTQPNVAERTLLSETPQRQY